MKGKIIAGTILVVIVGVLIYFVSTSEPRSARGTEPKETSGQSTGAKDSESATSSECEPAPAAAALVATPPNNTINFFLENSGSMNGYLTGNSEFKQALNLVLHNAELAFTVRTAYVNTMVYPSNKTIGKFVTDLTPAGIKVGDQTTSNINYMFEEAVEATSNGSVSILVSDGIYSLPKVTTSEEAITALDAAKLETRNTLIGVIQRRNLMTVVVKMTSNFQGAYYKADHLPVQLNQQRPYYIWIFGSPKQVQKALQAINLETLPGYKDRATFFRTNDLRPKYAILTSGDQKIGDFRRNHDYEGSETHEVEDADKASHGPNANYFGFGLAIDFSDVFLSQAHLLNVKNYTANPGYYQITSAKLVTSADLTKLVYQGLSFKPNYGVGLKTKGAYLGEVTVTLSNATPAWIAQSGSTNDNTIVGDTSRTFGFKLLMDGIAEAYRLLNQKEEILSLTVKIKP